MIFIKDIDSIDDNIDNADSVPLTENFHNMTSISGTCQKKFTTKFGRISSEDCISTLNI